jgi:hypothetical protein
VGGIFVLKIGIQSEYKYLSVDDVDNAKIRAFEMLWKSVVKSVFI